MKSYGNSCKRLGFLLRNISALVLFASDNASVECKATTNALLFVAFATHDIACASEEAIVVAVERVLQEQRREVEQKDALLLTSQNNLERMRNDFEKEFTKYKTEVGGRMDGWKGGVDGRKDGWKGGLDGRKNGWKGGLDGRKIGWKGGVDERKIGWKGGVDGRKDGWV